MIHYYLLNGATAQRAVRRAPRYCSLLCLYHCVHGIKTILSQHTQTLLLLNTLNGQLKQVLKFVVAELWSGLLELLKTSEGFVFPQLDLQ